MLVFFSGCAALVYELLWFRQLGLVFGNTVQAAATVLAAFMAGLAWGAHRARKWVACTTNPVRLFGFVEAGIGLYALLVPGAFALARVAYQHAAHFLPNGTPLLTGLRFLLALLVLFVPTMLMGATLPILSEAMLRSRDRFATKLGWLYGGNTAGATLGVLACGFLLVPELGVRMTNFVAAGMNLIVGGSAILLGRKIASVVVKPSAPTPSLFPSRRVVAYLAVAALCGALALAFETVWFRALTLVLGSTTYSFAVMVACFLLGIALGAGALGRVADRSRTAVWALASALAGIGLWTFISMGIYNAAPEYFLRLLIRFSFSWNGMLGAKAVIGAIFLVPLAVFSGIAFTAVVRLIRDDAASAGRAVGAAFSVNALGSAVGAAAGGFILLPLLGLEQSLSILGWVAVAVGLVIAWFTTATTTRRVVFALAVLASVALVRFNTAAWDPLLLSSGPYFTPWANVADGKVQLRERLKDLELVYYREGVTSTIDVKMTGDARMYYSSGGKVEADSSPQSMVLQRMMGHVPMLLHRNPRRVLNIGLGAGVTAGALTCYPDVAIEVAEFEPSVTNIAAIWAPRNHDLIRRGRYTLVVNDGRNHLLVTTNRYDVITSDPFEPVVAGAANLYTVDHFALARSRLAPNGVMAQFLPLYELSPADVLIILRSFVRVFPRTSMYFTGSDTILLGMTGETKLDLATVGTKLALPEVRASLAEVGIDNPERLLDMLVMDVHSGTAGLDAGPLNTDDHPIIEFSAPKNALHYTPDVNQRVLLDRFHDVPAEYLSGLSPEAVRQIQSGRAGLRSALQGSVLRGQGDLHGSVSMLRAAVQQAPANPIVRNELSESLVNLASHAPTPAEATALYEEALRANPSDFWALFHLVLASDAANNQAQADEYLRRAFAAHPDSALLLAVRGKRADLARNHATACRDLQLAVQKMPRRRDFWSAYAQALEHAGRTADAKAASARVAQLSK